MKAFYFRKALVLVLLGSVFIEYMGAALAALNWFPRLYFQLGGMAVYGAGLWVVFFNWEKPKVIFRPSVDFRDKPQY